MLHNLTAFLLLALLSVSGQTDMNELDHDPLVDEEYLEEDEDDFENSTEPGKFVGSPCNTTCFSHLLHVTCNPALHICQCEKKYPVLLDRSKGCAKPKLLGDQCFYTQTCAHFDDNAICAQVGHKAMCQCKPGFHTVGIQKGVKRAFCSEDLVVLSTDLSSLLAVAAGITMLSGLLCFVLKLFSSNRYGENGSNLAPPLLFSDNQWIHGIPLTVHSTTGRNSTTRSSSQRSASLHHYSRSNGQLRGKGHKGVLVPASRAGAARAAAILLIPCHLQAARTPDTPHTAVIQEEMQPIGSRHGSMSSIQSTASSQKSMSWGVRRLEQEQAARDQRAAMRAKKQTEGAAAAMPPTPSPVNSTDRLLPGSDGCLRDDPLGITSAGQLSVPSLPSMVSMASVGCDETNIPFMCDDNEKSSLK